MKSVISKLCSVLLTTSLIVSVCWTAPNQKEVLAAAKATIPTEDWKDVPAGTYTGDEILAMDDTDTDTKYLKLAGDVTVSDSLLIQSGTVHLDLAGYTLSPGEDAHDATVFLPVPNSNATVYIYDSSKTDESAGTGKILGTDNTNCVGTSPKNSADIYIEGGTYSGAGKSGIYSAGGKLKISGATITGNGSETATNVNGGGICTINPTELSITDCIISQNACDRNGGGIYFQSNVKARVYFERNTITNNNAQGNGGGIYVNGTAGIRIQVDLGNLSVKNNTASLGGGLYLESINKLYIKDKVVINENTDSEGNANNFCFLNDLAQIVLGTDTAEGVIGVTFKGDFQPSSSSVTLCQGLTQKGFKWESDDPAYKTIADAGAWRLEEKNEQKDLLQSKALSLSSSVAIVLNVAIPVEHCQDNTYLQARIGSSTVNVYLPQAEEVEADEKTKTYAFLVPVNITQLAEDISVSVIYEDHTSADIVVTSVMDIAMDWATGDGATAIIGRALLMYGASAQTHFGVNTDNLADKEFAEHNIPGLSADDKAAIDAQVDTYLHEKIESSDAGIKYYGSTMFFLSKNTLRHYFYVTGDISEYTFTYNGNTYSGSELERVGESKYYYIQFAGLGPSDIGVPRSVTVTKGEGDEAQVVIEFEYSAKNYLARILSNPSEHSESMINLAYAAWTYFDAVASYTPPTDPTPDP